MISLILFFLNRLPSETCVAIYGQLKKTFFKCRCLQDKDITNEVLFSTAAASFVKKYFLFHLYELSFPKTFQRTMNVFSRVEKDVKYSEMD